MLSKAFAPVAGRSGEQQTVLKDISFSAERGEFIAIIGPSGCGKSTILNAIAGLTSYDSGSVLVDGAKITEPGPDRAVVFQHSSLLPWRTVARNIAYGLELRRQFDRTEIMGRVKRALAWVGLSDFGDHYPHQISGGMQQRANIARALAVEPTLILMDEPFGALDALTRESLQDQLSSLLARLGRTTIFITHDIVEAVYLADKVLVMSARPGRIIAEIPVEFRKPRTRALTETAEFEILARRLRELLRPSAADL
jgi:NitT/TauT family transport system ATP-binding protein